MKSLHSILNFLISFCQSSMLPQVFSPGVYNKSFNVPGRVSCIAKQIPIKGAVASFDFT